MQNPLFSVKNAGTNEYRLTRWSLISYLKWEKYSTESIAVVVFIILKRWQIWYHSRPIRIHAKKNQLKSEWKWFCKNLIYKLPLATNLLILFFDLPFLHFYLILISLCFHIYHYLAVISNSYFYSSKSNLLAYCSFKNILGFLFNRFF